MCYQMHVRVASVLGTVPRNLCSWSFARAHSSVSHCPIQHRPVDVEKFYRIPRNELERIDPLDKCFTSGQRSVFDVCGEAAMMVRREMLDLTTKLSEVPDGLPNTRYVVYGGQPGVGKSTMLFYAMHYAMKKGWLILNFPKASELTKQVIRLAETNNRNEKLYDTPIDAVQWLRCFLLQNHETLTSHAIKTTSEYSWSARETTPVGTPLTELIAFTTDRIKYSSDAVAVIVKEVIAQSSEFRNKILVAIDGVNTYYGSTWVRSTGYVNVECDELVMVRAAKRLLSNDLVNGLSVCTVGPSDAVLKKELGKTWHKRQKRKHYRETRMDHEFDYEGPCTPMALLGLKGFHDISPFIPVPIHAMNDKELFTWIDYHRSKKWITEEYASTNAGKQEIKFLTGNNPSEMFRVARFL